MEGDLSHKALFSAAQLVRTYTDSVDGDVTAEISAVLDELGDDTDALRGLLASLAGLAGHAVMVITTRLEVETGAEESLERRLERASDLREKVLTECAQAVREFRPAAVGFPPPAGTTMRGIWDRRSGAERRMGTDRRRQPPGSSSEKINLRLFGERRVGRGNRRSGTDRRHQVGVPA
jgi:hypothetical protein